MPLNKETKHIYMYIFLNELDYEGICFFLGFIYSICSYIYLCFQLIAFVNEHIWHKALLMGYSVRFELTCLRGGVLMV